MHHCYVSLQDEMDANKKFEDAGRKGTIKKFVDADRQDTFKKC